MTARDIIPHKNAFCKPFFTKPEIFCKNKKPCGVFETLQGGKYILYKKTERLLQLALGLHALLVVQDLLADAQILGSDLQQLILCQELQTAFQTQLADGN